MNDKQPIAGVQEMGELAEYQTGAVVSRTIVKRPGGSITAFAFDEGQELSEHSVPYDACVYLVDGEAQISIDGRPHRLRAGQMLLLPANRPHAVKAVQRFKMILAMLKVPA